ncbi:hypothetical protein BDV96DRAFT_571602 [Lophiotrema nucula]|uniref:NACHT domain-containing protein n=1 Tax=Lophiotrema nucula TaxID=690887 RepID=A0A6A5ZD39_9PLEO|nr:hypothetical protein BDV96DRAFT_571602 [Lophiotrema nucula]
MSSQSTPRESRNPLKRLLKRSTRSQPSPLLTTSTPTAGSLRTSQTHVPGASISAAQSGPAPPATPLSPTAASPNFATRQRDFWVEAVRLLPIDDQKVLERYTPSSSSNTNGILSDILQAAEAKRTQVESDRWSINVLGKRIKVRTEAELVLKWLERFKQIGDIVVNADPIHAGLPWAAVRLLIQAAVADQEQLDALFSGLERVLYFLKRSEIYFQLYLQSSLSSVAGRNLEKSLREVYCLIAKFLAVALRVFEKGAAIRAWHAFWKPEDISAFSQKCQDAEERVELEVHNLERVMSHESRSDMSQKLMDLRKQLDDIDALRSTIQTMSSQVESVWRYQEAERRAEVLFWLSDIPYEDHHRNAVKNRTPDTGTWILRHAVYRQWEDAQTSMMFWLHGIPGAGKTKLVTRVVDARLQISGYSGFAYFYCNRDEEKRRSAESVLLSFVKQLAVCPTKDNKLHEDLLKLYDKKKHSGFASAKLSFDESKDILVKILRAFSSVVLVLDALDECHEDDRSILFGVFTELIYSLSHIRLKIFISSRRNDDIKRQLLEEANLGVEATDNEDDIRQFVMERIEEDHQRRKNKRLRQISDELKLQIIDVLYEKSNGMFQWAALQINQLLRLEREGDIRKLLGKLPKDLKQAYDSILISIREQDGSKPEVGLRALQWIQYSLDLMNIDLLLQAVCQDPHQDDLDLDIPDADFVLGACQNLVVIDAQGFCRFSHLSVEEYLETHAPWTRLQSRELIGNVCVTILLNEARDHSNIRGLRDYATWNHFYHFSGLEEKIVKGSRSHVLLCRFFGGPHELVESSAYVRWLRLLQVLRRHGRDESMKAQVLWFLEPTTNSLLACALFGFVSFLREWYETTNFDINTLNEHGCSYLSLTIFANQRRATEFLLENGANPNTAEPFIFALDHALRTHDFVYLQDCIDRGADLNANLSRIIHRLKGTSINLACLQSFQGPPWGEPWTFYTPLRIASRLADIRVMEFLMDNGAVAGGDAIYAAIRPSSPGYISAVAAAVEFLIARGADPGWTAEWRNLHTYTGVVFHGSNEIAELLGENGADVEMIENPLYASPLGAAASQGCLEVMRLLIDNGADVNITSKSGSVLAMAAWHGQVQAMKLLIKEGANVNMRSREDNALMAAVTFPNVQGRQGLLAVEFLIEQGADVNMRPMIEEVRTIDEYTKTETKIKAVTMGYGPLGAAAFCGRLDVMLLLIRKGADVNQSAGGWYVNALGVAASNGQLAAMQLLIDEGADVNRFAEEMHCFGSVLAAAAFEGQKDAIQLLLKNGADVKATLKGWFETALEAARSCSREEDRAAIVELLLGNGAVDSEDTVD